MQNENSISVKQNGIYVTKIAYYIHLLNFRPICARSVTYMDWFFRSNRHISLIHNHIIHHHPLVSSVVLVDFAVINFHNDGPREAIPATNAVTIGVGFDADTLKTLD